MNLYRLGYSQLIQSPKFPVTSICDLRDVINRQFRKFTVAPLATVHFLVICVIQLVTPNN